MSPEAAAIYGNFKEIVTTPGYKPSAAFIKAGLPENVSSVLVQIDFNKSATNRSSILDRWQREIGR